MNGIDPLIYKQEYNWTLDLFPYLSIRTTIYSFSEKLLTFPVASAPLEYSLVPNLLQSLLEIKMKSMLGVVLSLNAPTYPNMK